MKGAAGLVYMYLHGPVLCEDSDIVGRVPGGIGDHIGDYEGHISVLTGLQTHSEGAGDEGGRTEDHVRVEG